MSKQNDSTQEIKQRICRLDANSPVAQSEAYVTTLDYAFRAVDQSYALGVEDGNRTAYDKVKEWLHEKRMVVKLDNGEITTATFWEDISDIDVYLKD